MQRTKSQLLDFSSDESRQADEGSANLEMLAPPLIRPFGPPPPRKRGEGNEYYFAAQSFSRVVDIAALAEKP